MKKYILYSAVIALTACTGAVEDEETRGGQLLANSARLISSELSPSSLQIAAACSGTSCTPDNLQGRIFSAGALLGMGEGSYNMTFLADNQEIIQNPSDADLPEGTIDFNLGSPTTVSGFISIPTADSMPADPSVTRLETAFDYIDATVTLTGTSGGAADGTYTIRVVFRNSATEDDVSGTMQWGDKLVKLSGENSFKWCDSSDCSHTARPSTPLQQADIISASQNSSGQGNPNYVYYSIDLSSSLTVTHSQISCTDCLWTIDYNLTNAVTFTANPSTFTSVKDVVDAFKLSYACNSSGCSGGSSEGINATLTIGDAGSASN